MFLRSTNRHKDGKDHRYFSIVENRRLPGGKTAQRTVLYLGEINDRQQAAWRKTLEVFDEAEQRFTSMSLFPDDRELPADAIDLILMVDVYHELASPQRMLRAMKPALSPRGRIAIVEFRKEDPAVPIREEHKMSVAQAVQEFGAEGYVLDRRVDSLPWQLLLVFRSR